MTLLNEGQMQFREHTTMFHQGRDKELRVKIVKKSVIRIGGKQRAQFQWVIE